MRITLCSSAGFFDKLYAIKDALERRGYEVFLPSMRNFHHLEETALAKIQHDLIREHFRKIDNSDAIYVANYDKNGREGHIGGGVFLEMGKAFDRSIPIFLMKEVPRESSYREEMIALKPIVVGEDWEMLDMHLGKHRKNPVKWTGAKS
jgi:hypothetical protein